MPQTNIKAIQGGGKTPTASGQTSGKVARQRAGFDVSPVTEGLKDFPSQKAKGLSMIAGAEKSKAMPKNHGAKKTID
jgi:hypothetical protein